MESSRQSMETKRQCPFAFIARLAFGICLVLILIWSVSFEKLILSLAQVSMPYLLLALSYQYASIILGAFNQYILFTTLSGLHFKSFFSAYFKAYAFGLLLPGQIGDASIAFFLKSEGFYYSQTLSIYLLDKILTFILYVFILCIFIGSIMGYPAIMPLLVFIVLGSLMLFGCYKTDKLISYFPVSWHENRIIRFVQNLSSQLSFYVKHHPFLLSINFFLTCFKLGLVMLCYNAMITALDYNLSTWKVGLSALSAGIVGYIPVSIQGLGTVEAMALLNFKTLEVSSSDVLICYLILRSNSYVVAIIAFAATFFSGKKGSNERNAV